jgi:hypothetical protein
MAHKTTFSRWLACVLTKLIRVALSNLEFLGVNLMTTLGNYENRREVRKMSRISLVTGSDLDVKLFVVKKIEIPFPRVCTYVSTTT